MSGLSSGKASDSVNKAENVDNHGFSEDDVFNLK
jgi:hypothetical protein